MRMAEKVINAAIKSSPECMDSDKIPRLFVENPITNFSTVSDAEAIIDVIAILTFSSNEFFFLREKILFLLLLLILFYLPLCVYYCSEDYHYHYHYRHLSLPQLTSFKISSFTYIYLVNSILRVSSSCHFNELIY